MRLYIVLIGLVFLFSGCETLDEPLCYNHTITIINTTTILHEIPQKCDPIVKYVQINNTYRDPDQQRQYLTCVYQREDYRKRLNECIEYNTSAYADNMTETIRLLRIDLNISESKLIKVKEGLQIT